MGSSTHPEPLLVYNDDFVSLDLSWDKSFPSTQGYYVILDTTPIHVPTPAAGVLFVPGEFTSFASDKLTAGKNYFHVAPVDSTSNVGTIEGTFLIQVNTSAPALSSSSH